jgi:hypothetical protein
MNFGSYGDAERQETGLEEAHEKVLAASCEPEA